MNRIRTFNLLFIVIIAGLFLGLPQEGSAKWWDKMGEPQYGGSIKRLYRSVFSNFDPFYPMPPNMSAYYQYEGLISPDWATDRDEWPFNTMYVPPEYHSGALAKAWEIQDARTIVFHIREGVHWQDQEPVNGREFTAYDVQHHYERLFGTGGGYSTPSPTAGILSLYESVKATDDHTVVVKLKEPTYNALLQVFDPAYVHFIESPEMAKLSAASGPAAPPKGGPPKGGSKKGPPKGPQGVNWKYAAGTGPWMLKGFVDGSSVTYARNPRYWGTDGRHPENRLPYADEFKYVIIPDIATGLAALRSGKIDFTEVTDWRQASSLEETNPELVKWKLPSDGVGIDLRIDKSPFDDIRVRKALQMAIDRKTIAGSYYNGAVDGTPASLINPALEEWAFNYIDWPQTLKDEYGYNPVKAKQLLGESGYPDGFKVNIIAKTVDNLELLQIIKAYFMDIGVDMEIKTMDPPSADSLGRTKAYEHMFYCSTGGRTGSPRTPTIIRSCYSKDISMNWLPLNDSGYDGLIDRFYQAATVDEARQAFQEAEKYVLENHWRVYMFPTVVYSMHSPRLKGYSGENLSFTDRFYTARWWIDQELKKFPGK